MSIIGTYPPAKPLESHFMPPGMLIPFAGNTDPPGWIPCDGREISRATYPELFAAIGTTWGSPSSGSVFKVPDLRGRAPVGVDSNFAFAGNEGKGAGARGHSHGMGSHDHSYGIEADIGSAGWNDIATAPGHRHGGVAGGGAITDWAGEHGHYTYIGVSGHLSVTNNRTSSHTGGNTTDGGAGWAGVKYLIKT